MFKRIHIATRFRLFLRNHSTCIQVSDEVRQSLLENKPILALESTIITHGLPYPDNINMANKVESLIRSHNVTPATISFIDGIPKIGLSQSEIEKLGDINNYKSLKISRRDIPYIMSSNLTGGTTIASTMLLASQVGIDCFSTGGLGGVHRNGELTMDISADLDELSKTPVAVICSGPKSILDIEKTMEYLETKGVPVITYNDTQENDSITNIPGFYTRDSGTKSPFITNDLQKAAEMIYNGKYGLNLQNGYVFCIPPPIESALSKDYIDSLIDKIQIEADLLNIKGKYLTPFMLSKLNEYSEGASVKSNVEFVLNNALAGCNISKNLSLLKSKKSFVQPVIKNTIEKKIEKQIEKRVEEPRIINTFIIGSIGVDTISKLNTDKDKANPNDSNPGTVTQSIGGVGYNISKSYNVFNNDSLFISVINPSDFQGKSILSEFNSLNSSDEGLLKLTDDSRTCQYNSIHYNNGELVISVADFNLIEEKDNHLKQHFLNLFNKYKPSTIIIDSNLSTDFMQFIIDNSSILNYKIIYEPTSIKKSLKLSNLSLSTYPNNEIQLITPNIKELDSIYKSFEYKDKFNDIDNWFNVLDSLGIDTIFRNRLDSICSDSNILKNYLNHGIFQKSFKLLPYTPNILIKDGVNGILLIQLTDKSSENLKFNSINDPITLVSHGRNNLGVIVQYFNIPSPLSNDEIKNVTGAGDTLLGYLSSNLSKLINNDTNSFQIDDLSSVIRKNLFIKSQIAAGLSIKSESSVNIEKLKEIK
ncbi:hypothetical protein BVG19_g3880 [[Candida] boidinii]|nr:hypothetical protein BVG19_g3880 [[Candida] boidinii]OWB52658.1 catalytic activity protein [[Candida] boidinii]OWB85290.1 catalytic activity protein [[Candida] boidinii]